MPNKLIRLATSVALAAIVMVAAPAIAEDASPGQPAQSAPATTAPSSSSPAQSAPASPTPGPPASTPATSTPPATTPSAPALPSTAAPAPATPTPDQAKPAEGQPAPPGDSTGQIVDLKARLLAFVDGKADKDEIFSAIKSALGAVKGELDKDGLKAAGKPLAVFLESDESGFHYHAGYPLEAIPDGKTSLSDAVKLGQTPAGKAMRFQHVGAYSDIDATYDAITAYLDEKGVDAEDSFIEEYESDLKNIDDPSLQVDIYVLTK